MSFADDVKTIFVADGGAGGVSTLLTGGIYTFDDTSRDGISRNNTASAYDGTKLKPCCVIKERDQVPDNALMDDGSPLMSYRQVIEIWLYDNGDSTYDTLETVLDRIFALLHGQPIGTNSNKLRWTGNTKSQKEPQLENAIFVRTDYALRGLMTA